MAHTVIQLFEMVDVHHNQSMLILRAAVFEQSLHLLQKSAAIEYPGEGIPGGPLLQQQMAAFLLIDVFDKDKSLDIVGVGVGKQLDGGLCPIGMAPFVQTTTFQ